VKKIKEFFIKLAYLIQKDEKHNKVLSYIFAGVRLILRLILSRYNIQLGHFVLDPMSQEIAIIGIVVGDTRSFVFSWFARVATIVAPPAILSIFLAHIFAQQIMRNIEYTKWKNNVCILLENKDLKKQVMEIFQDVQNQNNNCNAIKLEYLN